MKKLALVGIVSMFTVLGLVGILTSAKASEDGIPVGTVLTWAGSAKTVPNGWMICNGKPLSKAVYAELFAAIGTSWGNAGDKFNLPDLRGRFLRGDDAGTGRDPDMKKRTPSNPGGSATGVGSVQEDSLQNHSHSQTPHRHTCGRCLTGNSVVTGTSPVLAVNFNSWDPDWEVTSSSSANIMGVQKYGTQANIKAGEESRPRNASVIFIIKVK